MVDWQSSCLMRAFGVSTYVTQFVRACVRVFVCSSMDVCVCMSVSAFILVPYSSVPHAGLVPMAAACYVLRSRRCDNIYTNSSSSHLW